MSSIILCSHADDSFVVSNVNRCLTSMVRAGFVPVDGLLFANLVSEE
jgi:hypothetical protein